MLIKSQVKKVYRSDIENNLDDKNKAREVLDIIFGDKFTDETTDYFVIKREPWGDSKTILQRFNMFWLVPLTWVIIPFQYILMGESGWSPTNKIGRLVLKLAGEYKD